jgi:hypothetical protein
VVEGQELGDRRTLRHAHDVRGANAERVEQRGGVGDQVAEPVGG